MGKSQEQLPAIYSDGVRFHSLTAELSSLTVTAQHLLDQAGVQAPLSAIYPQVREQVVTLPDLDDVSGLVHKLSAHFHQVDRERRFAERFSKCSPVGQILWHMRSALIRF